MEVRSPTLHFKHGRLITVNFIRKKIHNIGQITHNDVHVHVLISWGNPDVLVWRPRVNCDTSVDQTRLSLTLVSFEIHFQI